MRCSVADDGQLAQLCGQRIYGEGAKLFHAAVGVSVLCGGLNGSGKGTDAGQSFRAGAPCALLAAAHQQTGQLDALAYIERTGALGGMELMGRDRYHIGAQAFCREGYFHIPLHGVCVKQGGRTGCLQCSGDGRDVCDSASLVVYKHEADKDRVRAKCGDNIAFVDGAVLPGGEPCDLIALGLQKVQRLAHGVMLRGGAYHMAPLVAHSMTAGADGPVVTLRTAGGKIDLLRLRAKRRCDDSACFFQLIPGGPSLSMGGAGVSKAFRHKTECGLCCFGADLCGGRVIQINHSNHQSDYKPRRKKTQAMKYAVYTLGCKVNQYETQAIETLLRERGFEPAEEEADVVIVNTCAVTAESGRKSRQAIRRLKNQHPHALTAVCGCFSQLEPEQVKELGADIVFGSGEKKELVEAIVQAMPVLRIDDPFKRRYFEALPSGAMAGRTRAMLKIQDGCDNFCTYCVIPYTRGRVRSLPLEECAEEAEKLAAEGFREIVVTGIEIASYGKDLPGRPCLADAIERIARAAPDVRIHLGSLEPTVVTASFCERLAALGNVCAHFHLSLQAGCDKTLRRMKRKYDTERFYECCRYLKESFPGCSLTADLICGFPGETEEDFRESIEFLQRCGFFFVHAFPYSVRPGTKAADMPDQLTREEKENRVRRANETIRRLQRAYLESCVGKELTVLFESPGQGHGDNYCLVHTKTPYPRGTVQNVQIIGLDGERLLG